ncbi:hypothetical protein [Dyadobacter sp. OTU695]|uniref:hypothetical protein n=1 Tax=Dyadobacter sp. OTU695 TaxID=3043860 RepID=UPI00313F2F0A
MAKKSANRPVRPGTPASPSRTPADSNPSPAPTDATAATGGTPQTPLAEQTTVTQDANVRATANDVVGILSSLQEPRQPNAGQETSAQDMGAVSSDSGSPLDDDSPEISRNPEPDYSDRTYWTQERILAYEELHRKSTVFMDETGKSLRNVAQKQNKFEVNQGDMAKFQNTLYSEISEISKKVDGVDELKKIINTRLPEPPPEIASSPKMDEAAYPAQHDEYQKFKEWLCEETKGGRSICEPEGERRLFSASLEACEPEIDLSDPKTESLAIFRAVSNLGPITDPAELDRYDLFFKATICTSIELASADKTYEIPFKKLLRFAPHDKFKLFEKHKGGQDGAHIVVFEKAAFDQFAGIEKLKFVLGVNEGPADKRVTRYLDTTELFVNNVAAPHGERMLTKGLSNLSSILGNGVLKVQTQRNISDDTEHRTHTLWRAIRNRVPDFARYNNLMNQILGSGNIANGIPANEISGRQQFLNSGVLGRRQILHPLPFTNIQAYRLLKSATQAYLWATNNTFTNGTTVNEGLDFYINSYDPPEEDRTFTPYIQNILAQLGEWRTSLFESNPGMADPRHNFFGIDHLPAIELIWSYWTEQGMMVQTMNAISLRFQNITTNQGADPLAQMDIDPLRPLANLFWGYIQDEQHTLTIKRRAYEYDHTYGLQLEGRAVPVFKSVDSRSKFIEAFHNLLHSASIFFKESDDTTRVADPFSVLNNLREVHLLLAEGNHNAYGNLTWTARQEMLIQQYLLARPEMREFLGGRVMVPYREPWMDRVDRMRQIQNWGSTSITNYYDLAQFGEVLLLTIRAHDWSNEEGSAVAGSWASSFRNEIQRYLHSYRTVTGADLSADAQLTESSFMQPSTLIQRRLQGEQRGPLRNSRLVGKPQPQS